ncbi:hypothetical protein KFK09_008612 [Dendrobium nobile]|uniref:Uncharacterized protein n=1 Tax=Dendrobium nobile TaxID=94219 RepID=A0A8T3BL57_DENNO|nr:hypothetical protein KFK09_008612 [Dendrobium nobile]
MPLARSIFLKLIFSMDRLFFSISISWLMRSNGFYSYETRSARFAVLLHFYYFLVDKNA